jgi:hypothetical protein
LVTLTITILYHYVEFHVSLIIMLNAIKQNVIMLSVIWLNVIMLNVMTTYTVTTYAKPPTYIITHVQLIYHGLQSICKEANLSVVPVRWGGLVL